LTYSFTVGEKYLLLLGGRKPNANWIGQVLPQKKIWAVDRGLELCRDCNVVPSFILGDGDSASEAVWQWGKKLGVPVALYPTAKDFTDTQLALDELADREPNAFGLLVGAFGGRFDHAYSTIFSAASSKVPVCLADERELLTYVRNGESLSFALKDGEISPTAVSLLPLDDMCVGVTTTGLYWPLRDAALTNRLPTAISNKMTGKNFSVSVAEGCLAVYICFVE